MKYCFDWGEGNNTWSDYQSSGEPISLDYLWEEQGTYEVKVMAEDQHGLQTEWSDPLIVTMPFSFILIQNTLIQKIIQRFPLK